jgi:hypothetical protein
MPPRRRAAPPLPPRTPPPPPPLRRTHPPARTAAPRLLLCFAAAAAAALPRAARAADTAAGLNFSPDPRNGGLANNPSLIVFIVFVALLGCSCVMCAIGFAKFDWLRTLIKGEEPTEVELMGPPPPEPQGGRGNWVVRPRGFASGRMDTDFDDGDDVEANGWRANGGVGGAGRGGSAGYSDDGTSYDGSYEGAAYATEEEAAAAWLRSRGRGTLVAPPVPRTQRSGESEDGSFEESSAASASARTRATERAARPQAPPPRAPQAPQAPAAAPPPEVAAARTFLADAHRAPPRRARSGSASALSSAPSSAATSASSWWSRFVPASAPAAAPADGAPPTRWLGAPPPVPAAAAAAAGAASAAAPSTSFGARASLWERVRSARAAARPPPEAHGRVALRSPPSDVRAAAAWLGRMDAEEGEGSERTAARDNRRGSSRGGARSRSRDERGAARRDGNDGARR